MNIYPTEELSKGTLHLMREIVLVSARLIVLISLASTCSSLALAQSSSTGYMMNLTDSTAIEEVTYRRVFGGNNPVFYTEYEISKSSPAYRQSIFFVAVWHRKQKKEVWIQIDYIKLALRVAHEKNRPVGNFRPEDIERRMNLHNISISYDSEQEEISKMREGHVKFVSQKNEHMVLCEAVFTVASKEWVLLLNEARCDI